MKTRFLLLEGHGGIVDLKSLIFQEMTEQEKKAIFYSLDTDPVFVMIPKDEYSKQLAQQGIKKESETIFGLVDRGWLVVVNGLDLMKVRKIVYKPVRILLDCGVLTENLIETDYITDIYRPIYAERHGGGIYNNGMIDITNAEHERFVESYDLVWHRK